MFLAPSVCFENFTTEKKIRLLLEILLCKLENPIIFKMKDNSCSKLCMFLYHKSFRLTMVSFSGIPIKSIEHFFLIWNVNDAIDSIISQETNRQFQWRQPLFVSDNTFEVDKFEQLQQLISW